MGDVQINTNENLKNQVEFTVEFQLENGACIPVINGEKRRDLLFGYTSDADKVAAVNLIKKALKATGGNIEKAKHYMYNAMMTTAEHIEPAEQITVDGIEMMIDYKSKTLYTLDRIKVADLSDMDIALANEAVKAILVEKGKVWAIEQRSEENDDEYWL